MSTTTPNLGLFKYNPTTDGKEVFSIQTALNNNWDIIDNMDLLPDQTGKDGYLLTTNGSEASWGETSEIHCVVETFVDGTSWYRIYSDGWCEQGGYHEATSSSGAVTISLLKQFSNTSYQVILGTYRTANLSDGYAYYLGSVGTRTISSFTLWLDSTSYVTGCFWQACGYIEV